MKRLWAEIHNISSALCRALSALGGNHARLGKLDDTKVALNESLILARALGDLTRELFALTRLRVVTVLQGDLAEGERLYREVHMQAVAAGNRERAMVALNNLSIVADERGDLALAQEYSRQSLALAREIGAQQNIELGLINLADGDIQLGQVASARTGLREGLALALRLGALPWAVGAVINFAELAHAEGQTERALALFGLTRKHPALSSELQNLVDAALAKWALDPSVVEAGMQVGKSLDWEATVKELLKG